MRNRQVFPAGRDIVFSRAGNYRRVWRWGARRLKSTGFVRVLSYLEEGDYGLLVGFQREMARGKNAYSVLSRFAVNLGKGCLGQCRVFRVLQWLCWPLRRSAARSKPAPTRGLSRVGGSGWRGYLDTAERPIQTYSVMIFGAWREAASRSIKPLP